MGKRKYTVKYRDTVPLHRLIGSTPAFSMQKCAIFGKINEINWLDEACIRFTAQQTPQLEIDIAKKGYLWIQTT